MIVKEVKNVIVYIVVNMKFNFVKIYFIFYISVTESYIFPLARRYADFL